MFPFAVMVAVVLLNIIFQGYVRYLDVVAVLIVIDVVGLLGGGTRY